MGYEVHRGRGYVPMRIVARMDEPIAYLGDLLHIDGPLAYAAYHDLDEQTRRTIEPIETAAWPIDVGLPLSVWSVAASDLDDPRLLKSRNGLRRGSRHTAETDCPKGTEQRLWGWCASAADETAWLGRGKTEIRKKPDLGAMSRYTEAKSHNLGSGHMKAYDLSIPTVTALEVTWHAHGDPDRVRHLLSTYVPALGKKRNIGNGTVREWIIEPCHLDRSIVDEQSRLVRRMSLGAVDGPPGHGGIRPPYYHPSRHVASVEPWA